MTVESHSHPNLQRDIETVRVEAKEGIERACADIRELGEKIDNQVDRWSAWSDAQFGKTDEFRQEITRMIDSVKGAVERKTEIDATLMGTVQRIEKQFDQFAETRDRDLKELYTMVAKQEAHEKDIKAAHEKYRTLDQKVEKLVTDLPAIVSDAVTRALKEQEGRAMRKTLAWIAGIIGAVIAEFVALRLFK
jgi:archaellum component FlaC